MSNHGTGGGAGQPLLVLFNVVVVVAMAFSFASLGGIDWCGGSKVAAGGAEARARKQKGAGKAQGGEEGSKKGRGAK